MEQPLEVLAQELETIEDRDLSALIKKVRNPSYPRKFLIRDLREASLGFFATKVKIGYYEMAHKLSKESKENNG